MQIHLVLTIISDDKPGIVEQLAQTVTQFGGNWLVSHMMHIAGKFAGILQVSVGLEHETALREAFSQLQTQGLTIIAESAAGTIKPTGREFQFNVIGSDRPGIVHEIAQAFAGSHINMSSLETACSSMPWSGEPMFEASGVIQVPKTVNMDVLHEKLDAIGDSLAVDIRLEAPIEDTHH